MKLVIERNEFYESEIDIELFKNSITGEYCIKIEDDTMYENEIDIEGSQVTMFIPLTRRNIRDGKNIFCLVKESFHYTFRCVEQKEEKYLPKDIKQAILTKDIFKEINNNIKEIIFKKYNGCYFTKMLRHLVTERKTILHVIDYCTGEMYFYNSDKEKFININCYARDITDEMKNIKTLSKNKYTYKVFILDEDNLVKSTQCLTSDIFDLGCVRRVIIKALTTANKFIKYPLKVYIQISENKPGDLLINLDLECVELFRASNISDCFICTDNTLYQIYNVNNENAYI